MSLELKVVTIQKPDEVNLILGHSHFIKTVEDLYEAVVGSVPGVEFGLAFCEASQERLVRVDGTHDEMKRLAVDAAQAIGAGHTFVIFLNNAFPINVLNAVKSCPEVCRISPVGTSWGWVCSWFWAASAALIHARIVCRGRPGFVSGTCCPREG